MTGGAGLRCPLRVSRRSRRQDPARAADGVLGESLYARVLTDCAAGCGGGLGQSRPRHLQESPS